jgi:KDO2-lipid IV(A) lauroyltransferase
VTTRADSELSSVRWHARGLNNGLIFALTYHGVTRMPRAWSYAIGRFGTRLAYHFMRDGTNALVSNLRIVVPGASDEQLQRLARLTYRIYACDTIDFIRSLSMTPEAVGRMVRFEGDPFAPLLAEGRGVILVGGHFGNWELGGVALKVLRGYPMTVIGKPEASPIVAQFRRRMRDSLGIDTLEIGRMLDTALHIRRLLAANGVVAMLLDRHLGRDRVDVDFFGRRSGFLRTPAMIGYLSGAPLLPSFLIRQADGRFAGVCGDPIRVNTALPPEEAVHAATQAFATELERRIRKHPHLWYQFYPYWN